MTNRYNIDDGNGNTIDNMNKNWKPIVKDCTNCLYFDIETFYGVCNKHGVIVNDEKPCEDYEEQTDE